MPYKNNETSENGVEINNKKINIYLSIEESNFNYNVASSGGGIIILLQNFKLENSQHINLN